MNYLKTFLPYIFGNKKGKSYVLPEVLDWANLNFEEKLMFHTLQKTIITFIKSLSFPHLTSAQVYHIFGYKNYIPPHLLHSLIELYPNEYELFSNALDGKVLSKGSLQEILNHHNHQLSVIALFHKDRLKPGKIFIKKADGKFVHTANGHLWSVNVLGTSGRGLPFNHSNGSTPCGIYSIDGVMPEADKNYEFGKFRRLIVNFLQKSPGEENIKQFLPRTHHLRTWWLPCIVGRELGRSLLRIHGTGRVNNNPFSSYFPMIPSSGCLTTTERNFMGLVQINDQRELLDTLMEAMNLEASYENESKIHGLLYVIEFDGTYQALEFKR